MNFKDLDIKHKRHLLLNCKLVTHFFVFLNESLDENHYSELCTLVDRLNADIAASKDYEVDQLIADIRNKVDQDKLVVPVKVRRDRNQVRGNNAN